MMVCFICSLPFSEVQVREAIEQIRCLCPKEHGCKDRVFSYILQISHSLFYENDEKTTKEDLIHGATLCATVKKIIQAGCAQYYTQGDNNHTGTVRT